MRWRLLRHEFQLPFVYATLLVFLAGGAHVLGDGSPPWWLLIAFVWLFGIILWSSLCVVRHAEVLASRMGEPYGTLILTLSVIAIEVSTIITVMLHGADNPTLASETMLAVIMIIMNGMVGLSLLVGGLRHKEQQYNLQGASSYLSVIVVLCVLGLILPSYMSSKQAMGLPHHAFQVLLSLGLYVIFLFIQTTRHRSYFNLPEPADLQSPVRIREPGTAPYHTLLLLAYLVPVVLLAEKLAIPIDYPIETLGAPQALGGLIVAMLVCTPEAISAVHAAYNNKLQRAVNVSLGSVLASICLTIPAILVASGVARRGVSLGLHGPAVVLLLLTLVVSIITFTSARTNILQGSVHLILFAAYLFFAI
ncbi:MAG: calcium:proton antiporter [Gammaproteobacteria bacterium]|nr:calcium:proton antiporter [Gammaproteobacteria bacterium]